MCLIKYIYICIYIYIDNKYKKKKEMYIYIYILKFSVSSPLWMLRATLFTLYTSVFSFNSPLREFQNCTLWFPKSKSPHSIQRLHCFLLYPVSKRGVFEPWSFKCAALRENPQVGTTNPFLSVVLAQGISEPQLRNTFKRFHLCSVRFHLYCVELSWACLFVCVDVFEVVSHHWWCAKVLSCFH